MSEDFFALRRLTDVSQPHPWSTAQQFRDPATGEFRDRTLADHHAILRGYTLPESVTKLVRWGYDTALNLLLYSWYVPTFNRAGEMQALSTLELALRIKLYGFDRERRPGMAALLRDAGKRGLVTGAPKRAVPVVTAHGRAWEPERPAPDEQLYAGYIQALRGAIPTLRNRLAHGDPGFVATAYETVAVCGDLIEELLRAGD